ncbi:hypothetical protein F5972_03365 [Microbispora cellulosiformans]|uniref:Uncharacterized protein n=1 Tax=Microbispora cellulosiformans TaxID=2614688 RepID=A0A5J5KDF3_9ACTN|nr:hypothetical protein [Microbispora cellulosiformans]KAA9381868.1 hypothetical protein F5972_03365 [Microbispora cellulosiformans]
MGWLSNLLLPGRLRTGPTALLPARPDPKTLLAIAQLADPEARPDGDDVLVGGSRVQPPIELGPDLLAKLGVPGDEPLWACRIAADGPLPVDFFDKSLAEGIAYRLGGWSVCQGEPVDPAEEAGGDPVVYLPAVPEPEEVLPILAGLLHTDAVDAGRWPEGELVDGVVHVPVRRGRVADVYADDELVVTIEEGHRVPPVAQARWPYLTEIAVVRVSPAGRTEETRTTAEAAGGTVDAEGAEDEAAAAPGEEVPVAPGEEAARSENLGDPDALDVGATDTGVVETAAVDTGAAETGAADTGEAEGGAVSDRDASDGDAVAVARDALVRRAAVALEIAQRLQGIAADSRGFQLAEPADALPGGYAGPALA